MSDPPDAPSTGLVTVPGREAHSSFFPAWFRNNRRKLAVVSAATASTDHPASSGQHPRGVGHIGGLVALASNGTGAR